MSGSLSTARRRSLTRRFAMGSVIVTMASLAVFALTVFVVTVLTELSEPNAGTLSEVNWEAATDVLTAMAFALPPSLALAFLASRWLTRRTLTPIADLVKAAHETTVKDLGRRLPLPDANDELRDLVLAQNALFERLGIGFDTLSQFASHASHELRTPLAVVVSELEVALRRPRTEAEWRLAAERSLEELGRLNRIVEALLEFARADGPSPREDAGVEVHAVLEGLAGPFAADAKTRGLTLVFANAGAGPSLVRASEEAVTIAVSNLISNAIRYALPNGHIHVALERTDSELRIVVEDDGPGVTGEEVDLFAPFSQGREGSRARGAAGARAGIGLGLSITKRVAERWGGWVSAGASEALGGARFTVAFPAARGYARPDDSSSSLNASALAQR